MRRWLIAGSLGVVALAAILLLGWCAQRPNGLSLYQLLVDLRTEAERPGLTIETASKRLATPDAAFAFVRDSIRYSPYPGRQQLAGTVLLSRVANAPDRAMLLAALLEAMDLKVQLRSVTVSPGPEIDPAPGLVRPTRDAAKVKLIADRIGYRLDDELANRLVDDSAYADRMEVAAATLGAAEERIRSMVGFGPAYAAPEPTSSTLDLDRVWVEVLDADGAVAARYDPTYPELPFPEAADAFAAPVPATSITLSVERAGGVAESILEWSGPLPLGDVTLGFVPTIDPLAALAGPPDPGRVVMWTPILQVDGEQVTGVPIDTAGRHFGRNARTPPPYAPDAVLSGSGGRLLSARISSADASRFPEVSVALDLKTDGVPTWTAEDFLLADDGTRHTVRIRSLGLEPRPLVVVTDVSTSMDGPRFSSSKDAILALVSKLDPAVDFALVDFAGAANLAVPLGPVGDGQAVRDAVAALSTRFDTGIIAGMSAALDLVGDRPSTFLLLTDGEDNVGGDLETLVTRLKDGKHEMVAIAIGTTPDAALLQRLVREAGGTYQRFEDPTPLSRLYAELADESSGRLILDYTAAPGDAEREVSLGIADYAQELTGRYSAPPDSEAGGERLVLRVTTPGGGVHKDASRAIVALGGDTTSWDMLGLYRLVFDIGAYPETVGTAAYLTNWIDVLRSDGEAEPGERRIDFESASTVGSFRAVTTGLAGDGLDLSPGPNVYLLRQLTGPDGMTRGAFDVMQTWDRFGLGRTDEDAFRLQLAAGLAEGFMFDGGDSVTPLANAADLGLVQAHASPPETWSAAMQSLRETSRYAENPFFYAPSVPGTAWTVDYYNKAFEPFVGVGDSLAKGASVVEIAKGFDTIDTLLALYGYSAGFGLGRVNGVIGPGFSALVALKREENKLWCFSSVMLGYVSEAIDGTDDLVSRDPDKAQANAAALCKMDGRPEDFAARALRVMGKSAARSWAQKSAWEGIKYRATEYSWTTPKGFKRPPPGVKLSLGFAPLDGVFHSTMAAAAARENPAAFE